MGISGLQELNACNVIRNILNGSISTYRMWQKQFKVKTSAFSPPLLNSLLFLCFESVSMYNLSTQTLRSLENTTFKRNENEHKLQLKFLMLIVQSLHLLQQNLQDCSIIILHEFHISFYIYSMVQIAQLLAQKIGFMHSEQELIDYVFPDLIIILLLGCLQN